jgi:hypothetical protein
MEKNEATMPNNTVKIPAPNPPLPCFMYLLLDIIETWKVRSQSLLKYDLIDTRSNSTRTGTLLVDDMERLESFERVEQMGLTRFELAEVSQ